jgi:hypothetical protein
MKSTSSASPRVFVMLVFPVYKKLAYTKRKQLYISTICIILAMRNVLF